MFTKEEIIAELEKIEEEYDAEFNLTLGILQRVVIEKFAGRLEFLQEQCDHADKEEGHIFCPTCKKFFVEN